MHFSHRHSCICISPKHRCTARRRRGGQGCRSCAPPSRAGMYGPSHSIHGAAAMYRASNTILKIDSLFMDSYNKPFLFSAPPSLFLFYPVRSCVKHDRLFDHYFKNCRRRFRFNCCSPATITGYGIEFIPHWLNCEKFWFPQFLFQLLDTALNSYIEQLGCFLYSVRIRRYTHFGIIFCSFNLHTSVPGN